MKIRNYIVYTVVLLIIIGLLFIFQLWSKMETLSVISILLSGSAVIIALLWEGELKAKKEENRFLNLTKAGLGLLVLFVVSTFGNGIISIRSIQENESKSYQDSLRFAHKAYNDSISLVANLENSVQIIENLKNKRMNDSIEVLELKSEIKRIDTTLVNNYKKTLKFEAEKIERTNENTFILFRNEVEENLNTILIAYDDKHIDICRDTTSMKVFPIIDLNIEYVSKLMQISNNSNVNEYLLKTKNQIILVNTFRNSVFSAISKDREFTINQFVRNKERALKYLIPIYNMTEKLSDYKSFLDSDDIYKISDSQSEKLKNELKKKFENKNLFNPK